MLLYHGNHSFLILLFNIFFRLLVIHGFRQQPRWSTACFHHKLHIAWESHNGIVPCKDENARGFIALFWWSCFCLGSPWRDSRWPTSNIWSNYLHQLEKIWWRILRCTSWGVTPWSRNSTPAPLQVERQWFCYCPTNLGHHTTIRFIVFISRTCTSYIRIIS